MAEAIPFDEVSEHWIKERESYKMDCDKFIEELYRAGWKSPNDAQHTKIRDLWTRLEHKE